MAIQAVPTISEEIYLRKLSKRVLELEGEDCPPAEQAWVKVRQATEGDQLQVSQRYAESEVYWQTDGSIKEKRSTNMLDDRMFKAYLVLVDAGNIVDSEGAPLFEFKDSDDFPRFKGTYSKFKERWSQLPPVAATSIEMALYSLNPQWGRVRERDDEEGED